MHLLNMRILFTCLVQDSVAVNSEYIYHFEETTYNIIIWLRLSWALQHLHDNWSWKLVESLTQNAFESSLLTRTSFSYSSEPEFFLENSAKVDQSQECSAMTSNLQNNANLEKKEFELTQSICSMRCQVWPQRQFCFSLAPLSLCLIAYSAIKVKIYVIAFSLLEAFAY